MTLSDALRWALDRDERLNRFDLGEHVETIAALPEGPQTGVTVAGRGAAEGLLCGLPPNASEDEPVEAVARLTQGDPLVAASAITFLIALHEGWGNVPPLLAAEVPRLLTEPPAAILARTRGMSGDGKRRPSGAGATGWLCTRQ